MTHQATSINNISCLPEEIRNLKIDMDNVYFNPNPTNVVEECHLVYLQVPGQGKCLLDVGVFTDGSFCFGDPDPEDLEEFAHLINEQVYPVEEYGYTEENWLKHYGDVEWEYSNL